MQPTGQWKVTNWIIVNPNLDKQHRNVTSTTDVRRHLANPGLWLTQLHNYHLHMALYSLVDRSNTTTLVDLDVDHVDECAPLSMAWCAAAS